MVKMKVADKKSRQILPNLNETSCYYILSQQDSLYVANYFFY